MTPKVHSLHRYPVKSAAGRALDAAAVERRGFAMDRRWMVVEPDGTFLSQRTLPRLALVEPELTAETLRLAIDTPDEKSTNPEALELPRRPDADSRLEVEVWGDRVSAVPVADRADRWLTRRLGVDCRLVYMPDSTLRHLDDATDDVVSFVDGYPFLLVGRASLDALNRRLESPLSMDRFRPNIVVEGADPFAEDDWERLRIGEVEFRVAGPCTRCSVTTVDQSSARRGDEPLATLADFRRTPDGDVAFGQYLVHESRGTLRAGDPVDVLE